MTKTEITQKLNALEQYGFLVATFNSFKYTATGFKGFPDHEINGKRTYYIEVKLGYDTYKPRQEKYREILKNQCYNKYYELHDEKDLDRIIDDILISEMTLGQFLKHKRKELNKSLREVAENIEFTAMHISDIENDKKICVKGKSLKALAKYYKIDYSKLMELAINTIYDNMIKYIKKDSNIIESENRISER